MTLPSPFSPLSELANKPRLLAIALALAAVNANGLLTELRAAVGYMRNAKIDLETGATKATAIRTIAGGIKRAEEAIAKAEARDAL